MCVASSVQACACWCVCMFAQVTNSGITKVKPDADEEADGTVPVDATPTEIMRAPEQAHTTPAVTDMCNGHV